MRPQKSLADYVAIAICPVLIMALVGSLMFFLLEVVYQGAHDDKMRLAVVCFVAGIVLIARISMTSEISRRAGVYGVFLAIAAGLVVNKYIEFPEGHWAARSGLGFVLNLGIMALIWWTAHKLTWDCTLIDDDEDASGQGLLQAAGLEQNSQQGTGAPPASPAVEPEAAKEKYEDPATWWTRLFSRAKKPKQGHTPGIWIVYYSLAALPLFGLGQMMIPADQPDRRRYAFWLLAIYVAAGLGLLLATSFLGLRRYLRQKKLQMPAAMTGVWMLVGSVFVVMLLGLGALLPRPNPEFFNLITPLQGRDQRASKHDILGGKGAKGEGREGNTSSDQPGGSRQGNTKVGQGGQGGKGSQGSQGKGSSGQGSQAGKGDQSSQGKQSGKGSESGQGNQKGSGNPSGKQGDSSQGSSGKGDNQQPTGPPDHNNNPQTGNQNKTGQGNSADKTGQGKSNDSNNSGDKNTDVGKGERNPDAKDRTGNKGENPRTGDDERREQDADKKDQNTEQESGGGSPSQSPTPQESPDTPEIAGTLGSILKWIIYGILAFVAIFLLIRYWRQVLEALKGMLQGLRDFWARLFGWRREEPESAGGGAMGSVVSSPEPFSTFRNPFLDGTADSQPVNETTAYSFEALEAWAHEHGMGREPEETPMEFAARIGEEVPDLAPHAKRLGENYSRVTYARASLARTALEPLRLLWQRLKPRVREMAEM